MQTHRLLIIKISSFLSQSEHFQTVYQIINVLWIRKQEYIGKRLPYFKQESHMFLFAKQLATCDYIFQFNYKGIMKKQFLASSPYI